MPILKINQIDNTCTGCGACANICPKQCISVKPDSEGFYYPSVDEHSCIGCKQCEKVCHVINPISEATVPENGFIMYKSNDDNVREASTSGGAFTLMVEEILRNGGLIFGSLYNYKTHRLEVSNSDTTDWKLFRKSKYVETFSGITFSEVAAALKTGRMVLYCSTACQIRGLKQYLNLKKVDTSNLISVDLICHGVPSNDFFNFFLKKFGDNKGIKDLNFRHKDFSNPSYMWHSQGICINYHDGTRQLLPNIPPKNFFYYAPFNDAISLRKCCYSCSYPKHSYADITIADFWGIKNHLPQLDDNKGISLIKINTPKGSKFWASLNKLGYSEVIDYNIGEYVYNKLDKRPMLSTRNRFYKIAKTRGYNKAVWALYRRQIITYRIKAFIKLLIGRK